MKVRALFYCPRGGVAFINPARTALLRLKSSVKSNNFVFSTEKLMGGWDGALPGGWVPEWVSRRVGGWVAGWVGVGRWVGWGGWVDE